jgi:hypothetical protein
MEASQVPNLVDRNFIWGTRGNGIYQHDCDGLVIAQNFIGRSADAGIRMQVCQGRIVGGRVSTAKRNKILGNVLVDNGTMLAISDAENSCDYNLFGSSRKAFDLGAWQKEHGWDKHSVQATLEAAFDTQILELTWKASRPVPDYPRPTAIACDFWDRPYQTLAVPPGPFGVVPTAQMKVRLGIGEGR